MSQMLPSTICALSTVEGKGAIAVIRLSGPEAINITDSIFKPAKGAPLHKTQSYRLRFGAIYSGERMIDEVLVSLFRAPNSYTGEEMTEISCHGSYYIQQEILMLLLTKGAKLAKAGEFSQRAFLNGKMDLAQAEAVADLISSENEASHRVALQQMKGGFSKELAKMRSSLLEIVSLMELELDFAEEDVEFADRNKLKELLASVEDHITLLIDSFRLGNVIKNGIPVAIAGATNTGKSTLLNLLLQEERAIVSDIHGTTRDYIEGYMNIEGVGFRFIDTAGIRETKETIEMIGIERSYGKIKSASVILLILDAQRPDNFEQSINQLASVIDREIQKVILLINKSDLVSAKTIEQFKESIAKYCTKAQLTPISTIAISAKALTGIDALNQALLECRLDKTESSYTTLVT
ncbi:MAG: tRNA uridine-5-carboxymethylaminomethyl(34) synthesis GTPase MnmE, partial [Bacteroidales bacterium]